MKFEFEKLNNSNELERKKEEQKNCVLEIEDEEKIRKDSKDENKYQIAREKFLEKRL